MARFALSGSLVTWPMTNPRDLSCAAVLAARPWRWVELYTFSVNLAAPALAPEPTGAMGAGAAAASARVDPALHESAATPGISSPPRTNPSVLRRRLVRLRKGP